MALNTGNGTTLTIGGSAVVANITSIKGPTAKRAVLDTTTLATTGDMESIPGDLAQWDELEFEFLWNDEATPPSATSAAASVVLTFAIGALATAANLTGTGFITEVAYPTFEKDTVLKGSGKIKFDGVTGPTYTAGSPS